MVAFESRLALLVLLGKRRAIYRWLAVFLALGFLTGCATDRIAPGSRFVVATPTAEFFKHGPAQNFQLPNPTYAQFSAEQEGGPDFDLPKGTIVTLLKREFGYSRILTNNGIAAYVSNDQLRPAPPLPASTRDMRSANNTNARARQKTPPPPRKGREEQLDLNDLPLPLPG